VDPKLAGRVNKGLMMKVLFASADELDSAADVLTLMLASLDCSGRVCWVWSDGRVSLHRLSYLVNLSHRIRSVTSYLMTFRLTECGVLIEAAESLLLWDMSAWVARSNVQL
jgi:hypothetical protein